MIIQDLYADLMQAFSTENLNQITSKIILLYKNKNFGQIRKLANQISKYVAINEEKDSKCFSKLIMLYHPDRGEQFRNEIQRLYSENKKEELTLYSHIFLLSEIDKVEVVIDDEDIEYNPEFVWDIEDDEGYNYTDSYGEATDNDIENEDVERSFYNMIKIREYGTTNVEFPSYYLEDFDDFEMACCGLESLDGVEHCIHVKTLDISQNELTDIHEIWSLDRLEEFYAAYNQIGYIDALSNILHLRIVDISYNQIDDITPLLQLENLEFVNVIGNKIPLEQINNLKQKGIVVIS